MSSLLKTMCGVVGALAATSVGCGRSPDQAAVAVRNDQAVVALESRTEAEVAAFCGGCHKLPLPESFPRSRWAKEVRQGYDFYLESGRDDLVPPVERDAVRFFAEKAPEQLLNAPVRDRPEVPTATQFVPVSLPAAVFDREDPAIADVVWRSEQRDFLASDMRSGRVYRFGFYDSVWEGELFAEAAHPCRLVPWPGSDAGYLVGDLGSFMPADHSRGSVRLLRSDGNGTTPLMEGLARVVEAQPFDADEDGDLDLVVAEFGWRQTGALRLLIAESDGSYRNTVLDPRHGAVAVRIADMDADGHDDVVVAFGQEHESVEVYWNDGKGGLMPTTILALPDPSWGSSGFELVDIDRDGRLDLVHANGDTLDSGLAKPYHGIRIVRNRGNRRFEVTEVAAMVGVCQVSAADLDGDEDIDLVACALFQDAPRSPSGTFDGLTWFEQNQDGSFTPHSVARDACEHVAFELADLDADGRVDIVAGVWQGAERGETRPIVVVYRNQRRDPAELP